MSLRNVIEYSMAATATEEAMNERRSQVKQLQPAHIRLAVQSIDTIVFAIPSLKLRTERAKMQKLGLELIGSGAESRVYSDGQSVLKYVVGSEYLESQQRQELKEKKAVEFDQLHSHMAPYVLDQFITVAPHIAKPGKEVVQTEQPFVVFTPLIEHNQKEGTLILNEAPTPILDALSNFVDDAWKLYGKTSLLPDVNGKENIVQHENKLILIDTQPITPDNEPVQELVKRQLSSLALQLETIS